MMIRRFYSVLFLILILFNTIGYYCLFFIDKQKTEHIARIIEGNANEISGNIIFRIPMDFPNAEIAKNFKPVDGEITYDGETYHLVKQKLYQDTLYVVCIKDTQRKEIREVIHDYAESFTDHPINSNSGVKIFDFLSKDYISTNYSIQSLKTGWAMTLCLTTAFRNLYNFTYADVVFQPPQQIG
ncbi:MAG TPA: hypothetical protein VL443_11545 [Cyclobacteriaceae bacterium]|jgi:hypothetical protein|nr:hypothetical protein [Cyclobacteriaceae bacterium]